MLLLLLLLLLATAQGRALPQSAAAADPNGGVWVVGLSKASRFWSFCCCCLPHCL
jgi:hypothetical protein